MRRSILAVLALTLTATLAFGHGKHGNTLSINSDFDQARDCSALKITSDGERIPVTTEDVNVAGMTSLRVQTLGNGGGVHVFGTNRASGYSVRVCKAALAGGGANEVRVSVRGNEIVTEGPDTGRWVAYYIIEAPRNADLTLEAANGPISLDGVNGRINARATNGPISVKRSSGDIDVTTQNGPIDLTGGSGDVKATVQNGPLTVRLDGTSWNGNLEASTQNGPLTLKLPRNFRSGVLVESRGHGPVNCRAEGCYEQQRANARSNKNDDDDWNQDRRFEFGSGPANVKLSTVNGPLSIKDAD